MQETREEETVKRYVSLEEISDGKLYSANDMVKADCHGCDGCSGCCQGMGSSIILDPYDAYRLTLGLGTGFAHMIGSSVELNVVDGVVLPNLRMAGEKEACFFLNAEGRCSIHSYRPGICRLFPLGRYYGEDGELLPEGFRYFLQTGECEAKVRSKIKAGKWLDTPNLKRYEAYISFWHQLLKRVEEAVQERKEEDLDKQLSMLLLQLFFLTPYEADVDFYEQFERRYQLLIERFDFCTVHRKSGK